MGPENGSPQPIELGAILEPKLIKNEVDKYAEICHSKMRNRVGKRGPKWSPEYDEIAKNDTRNHPEGRSKTGLEQKQRRRQKRMRFEVPKTSESTVRSSKIMVLGGAKKT